MVLLIPLLVLGSWLAPQQTPANLQAKQLVDQSIAALGGDRYLQSQYLSGDGHLYSFNSSGELNDPGTEFWAYYRFPADERIELTKHRNVIYIYSGGQGWEITYKGVAPALRRDLAAYQERAAHALDTILKTWSRNPQTLMIDQGLGSFDGAQVESVYFQTQSGLTATVDFDYTSHLPLRVSWRQNDPLTGGHFTESVVYGNWASLGGVQVPYSLDHFEGPQRLDQRYFDHLSLSPLPAFLFTPAELKH